MNKKTKNLILLVTLFVVILIFWRDIQGGLSEIKNELFPCKEPKTYSVGVFDRRFDVPKEDFVSAVQEAEVMWEEAAQQELFSFAEAGGMSVNLVYDSRQEATEKLQELGGLINSDKETYNSLKEEYENLRSDYFIEKTEFEQSVKNFEARKVEFESQVQYWNSQGGAPQGEFNKIEAERSALNREAGELNTTQSTLNQKINDINAMAIALNKIAQTMNKGVSNFNEIADIHGEEFEEGNYEFDSLGERINIYQFESRQKLVRVLAHEFGHALGILHVEDPDSIMYKLNDSSNMELTEDDINALKEVCKL